MRRLGNYNSPIRAAALAIVFASLAACSSGPRIDPSIGAERSQRLQKSMKLTERADRAVERGRVEEALSLYRQAVGIYPDLASAWNNMGVLLLSIENYIDAVESFKKAGELNPSDPRPISNIGLAYHKAGFDEKALDYYEQALDRDPRWLDALRGGAKSNMRLRAYDNRALQLVEHAMLTDPDSDWRAVYQRERFRIEESQRQASREN